MSNALELARDCIRQMLRDGEWYAPEKALDALEEAINTQSETEGLYERMWKDFVSLQRGDFTQIAKDAEKYRAIKPQAGMCSKGQEFKDYVHHRLDGMGVPHSVPESEHDKAGCRIGGRLDHIEKAIKTQGEPVFIVFDGPPDGEAPRFIEVETADGRSVGIPDWHEYPKDIAMADGLWRLGPLYTQAKETA